MPYFSSFPNVEVLKPTRQRSLQKCLSSLQSDRFMLKVAMYDECQQFCDENAHLIHDRNVFLDQARCELVIAVKRNTNECSYNYSGDDAGTARP